MALLPFLFAGRAEAADPTISVSGRVAPSALGPGEVGVVELEVDVPEGWHLWSMDPGPGPLPLSVALPDTAAFTWKGPWHGDEPHVVFDRGFKEDLAQYAAGKVHLSRLFEVKAGANPGAAPATLKLRGQICTEEQCLEQRKTVEVALTVADFATGAAAPSITLGALTMRTDSVAAVVSKDAPKKPSAAPGEEGLVSFILLAFGFGLLALATPCVFPAIPLTVSFFSKYSEESFGRGARLAGVYALTMVIAFTGAGVLISILFGVTGVQRFASHPVFNLFLGAVLAFFALNLLGLFEIRAPAFLTNGANRLEMKFGRAASLGANASKPKSGLGDYLVVAIAAITATTVFFTCTVGFVGLVIAAAARGEWIWPTIGMLSFSSAFALPFFFLAMFPQAARRLQGKAGGWLGATRVTLGFLELAAATKFLSNADLVWTWGVLTRDLVLAFWIPLFVLCGMYLIGKIRIGHEGTANAEGGVSVLQVLAATAMFSLSLYLAVGLFNGRSFGGWVDGWLPPLQYPNASGAVATSGGGNAQGEAQFAWIHDLEKGRATANAEGKLVFVNYTGYTCTNCRYMEGGMFPKPEIASLLNTMTLVELYTDGGTPEHDNNRDDQVKRFETAALPFYSVERPDGTVIASFPSSTNDTEEFRKFLADAIESAKTAAPKKPEKSNGITLVTTRLADGLAGSAIVPGKWNLVNFWGTWCGPCKVELEEFMADVGNRFQERGQHFATVAIEEDENVPAALSFMRKIKVEDGSALRLPAEFTNDQVDAKFEFDGSGVPYTVLVSPAGEIVWRHQQRITEPELEAVLIEHTGYAAR